MELTQNQINQLYKFTRQHYVYHYDVQTELVDHLANDIEEICTETPSLSFEEARDKSFKKFGIFGFMDVIEAKQKQMNKRYRKILWRFFKEWFTLPKVLLTFGFTILLFFILKIPFSEYVILTALFGIVVFDMFQIYKQRKQQKQKQQKQEKIFLLEAMIGETRQGFTGLAFINIFNFINLTNVSFSSLDNSWLLVVSFSAVLIIILFYVTAYLMPNKAEELLEETYPEYKLVKSL
ncbi:hypothetical protein FDT66_06655 [Polaribacter aestuariivivens]|uniref:Uncharacterized protein n=1 Tax=Polaribacter aestuariivivens TaxID=2304626 RepID=A0A5S3N519_9FLAO|nr:hypothetical protein [Polaribacter aestuariivivens]TMM30438.1 hypothetical protein FDT66_06655 [Polaribacter aestuariivivens]